MKEPGSFTVVQLKEVLKNKKLSTHGTKNELITRLMKADPEGLWMDEIETDEQENASGMGEKSRSTSDLSGGAKRRKEVLNKTTSQENVTYEFPKQPLDDEEIKRREELERKRRREEEKRREDELIAAQNAEIADNETRRQQDDFESVLEENQDLIRELNLVKREKRLLAQQVALLEREKNLMEQEAAILTQPQPPANNQVFKASLKTIGESLAEFKEGTDFIEWEKQVKYVVRVFGLDEQMGQLLVTTKLKGKAATWFHSKAEHRELSLTDLLAAMKKFFDHRPTKLSRKNEFEQRKWLPNERFEDYFYDKNILANRVPLDDEEEIIECIIEGIPERGLKNQARMLRIKVKEELLAAFKNIMLRPDSKNEGRTQSRKEYGALGGAHSANASAKQDNKVTKIEVKMGKGERKELKCYNCNGMGHMSKDCKKPQREKGTCYICSKTGHKAMECPDHWKNRKPKEESQPKRSQVTNIYDEPSPPEECREIVIFEINDSDARRVLNLDTQLDTGSPISIIKERFVDKQSILPIDSNNIKFVGINKSPVKILGVVKAQITLFNLVEENIPIYVVDEDTIKVSALLGRDVLIKTFKLALKPSAESEAVKEILNIQTDDSYGENDVLKINENLDAKTKLEFEKMFVVEYVTPKRPEEPNVKEHLKLRLIKDKPFYSTPRRLAYDEKEKLRVLLDRLLEKGIIRPSNSEYASPIVLVKKKNGELRMCVDYRELNDLLARDNYPLPVIEDLLNTFEGKVYFTSFDLKDGYYHIKVDSDSVKYTSFITPFGQFEFLFMPFGIKVAAGTFQRYIVKIFEELIRRGYVVVFQDDIMLITKTLEEHLEILKSMFRLMVENKLNLRIDKCQFLQTEIEFLGYFISKNGIQPTRSGVKAVENFPVPRNVREVQSFLGLCSFFRKFIESFSLIAKPLYDLLRKNIEFKIGEEQLKAFDTLKSKLISTPILAIYNPKDETELHCDASAKGFGATLMQKKSDGRFHPIFYYSKLTSDAESRYHSFELETLAIIYALRKFRIYLQGIKFKIVTDCDSLTLTLKKKELNPRIARWALELMNYDYTVEHRPGVRMRHVDALSRKNAVIMVIEDNPLEWNLLVCQNEDPTIVEIREGLECKEDKMYELRNGLVYRKKDDQLLLYVPRQMETNVIYKYHDEMGHLGKEKTCSVIMQNYWFPKMHEKVQTHIKNCLKCIAFSPMSGKREGYLHIVPKGNVPFATIHVDHVGPIDKNRPVKQHVLVVVDGFTKFVKLYACKTTTSKEAIKYLTDYFQNFSRPNVLVSDRGSCFTSNEFKDFLESKHIKHVLIATGSPQANGQVERMNRVIVPMLAKMSDTEVGKYWYKVIGDVEFALNNTINKSTNQMPSKLLFGITQRGNVVDDVKEYLESTVSKDERCDLEQTREQAAEKIVKLQEYNKEYTDKKRRKPFEYGEGDLVMLKNFESTPGVSRKLMPQFKGPYVIKRKLRYNRYVVGDPDGLQNSQKPYEGVWEANNMKPWKNVSVSEEIDVNEDNERDDE